MREGAYYYISHQDKYQKASLPYSSAFFNNSYYNRRLHLFQTSSFGVDYVQLSEAHERRVLNFSPLALSVPICFNFREVEEEEALLKEQELLYTPRLPGSSCGLTIQDFLARAWSWQWLQATTHSNVCAPCSAVAAATRATFATQPRPWTTSILEDGRWRQARLSRRLSLARVAPPLSRWSHAVRQAVQALLGFTKALSSALSLANVNKATVQNQIIPQTPYLPHPVQLNQRKG
ncbi:hypothetical protein CPC08DRAFT_727642 [Agrocybe pediades]|nr:hypothetical protein CPC08DRAFT_727642 [Agrocybe pediades]